VIYNITKYEKLHEIHSLLLENKKDLNESDIDAIEMMYKLVAISELLKPSNIPLEIFQFILNKGNFVLNERVAVAVRIILTMPVSVESGQRSFSKSKIIKNHLRSSMNQ
jgi:hypothetical protein